MYLPHMIRSMLKLLQLGESDQSLLSFMDQAMKVEERKKLLESRYSQELSLLYVLQEDYDRAKYYSNSAMQMFMEVRFEDERRLGGPRFFYINWVFTPLCVVELLKCGYAADSKSPDHPAVSAGLDGNPGLPALHQRRR